MRGLAGGGDNHLDAAVGRGLRPFVNFVRRAVRAGDDQLVGNAQALQLSGAALHNGQIGLRAHDDSNKRGLLGILGHGASQ